MADSLEAGFTLLSPDFLADPLSEVTIMVQIVIIDSDPSTYGTLKVILKSPEYTLHQFKSASEALQSKSLAGATLIIIDAQVARDQNIRFLHVIQSQCISASTIVLSNIGDCAEFMDLVHTGAVNVLSKPLDVLATKAMISEVIELHGDPEIGAFAIPQAMEGDSEKFVGTSRAMLDIFKRISSVAGKNVPVLITGETGTGKEHVARALYSYGSRAEQAYMTINVAALTDTLLESEMFGHEKGAFTGAERRRVGKFEQCSGGTLFLDEIGDMSQMCQSKVLRVLQDQRFERVGGNETIQTDVRVIAATNRDLESMIKSKQFRDDLYYRLASVIIHLPPLRERKEDIPLLLKYFLARISSELDVTPVDSVTTDALSALTRYDWPGNVREMFGVLREAILNLKGSVLGLKSLPTRLRRTSRNNLLSKNTQSELEMLVAAATSSSVSNLFSEISSSVETILISKALSATNGDQLAAARILGVSGERISHWRTNTKQSE